MTARKTLRPHQKEALAQLRRSVGGAARDRRRARIMLKLATGAGKTVIAAAIVRGAREKGKRVLFIVDAISLIDQTVEAFWAEGIAEIGVIQANHPMNEGIPDCIILDHADNTLRMGFVTDVDQQRTTMCTAKRGERSKTEREIPLPKECPSCHYLKPPKVRACPGCGFMPERQSTVAEAAGELAEVRRGKSKKAEPTRDDKQRWFSELTALALERRYKTGWVSNTYKKKFGVWPQGLSPLPRAPSPEVRRFVKSLAIAFAHRRAA